MKSKTAFRVTRTRTQVIRTGRSTCVHFQSRSSIRQTLLPVGGAGRDRTDDLRLAKAALPQLSYSPVGFGQGLVGLSGFEPLTSRLSAVRSNQLSYRPGNNRSESNLKMLSANAEAARQEQSAPQEVPGDGTLKTRQARNYSSFKGAF
jgi:hypothetical protein